MVVYNFLASSSNTLSASNGGTVSLSTSHELGNVKGETNIKQPKENTLAGKKKNVSEQNSANIVKNKEGQESIFLENMETEVQSPIKSTSPEKDINKMDSHKANHLSAGKMDPPKTSSSRKSGTTPVKNASNIVQAPTTSSTVGGPSLPHRSSIGSSNQDFSSFRTYR